MATKAPTRAWYLPDVGEFTTNPKVAAGVPAIEFRPIASFMHPLRVQILDYLSEDPDNRLSPTMASGLLGVPLNRIAYHFRQLAEAGDIEVVKKIQRRGSIEHVYRRRWR